MAKYLIINADDYGLCKSANDAVEELFLNGRLKSSTIMMPCPGARDAMEFAKSHPEFAIGVHLTMTNEWNDYRWKPLSDGKTLVNDEGYMWRSSTEVEKNADIRELEAEVRAQVNFATKNGFTPSHLDNHMGSLYGHYTGRFSLLKMSLRVCGELGYAYRMYTSHDKRICPAGTPYPLYWASTLISRLWAKQYKVILPDYLLFPDWTKELRSNGYEHYRDTILKIWTDLPDGVTETFVHPAKETDELKSIVGSWQDRVWEYNLMNDPETHKILESHGITLISYRDLIEMKKKK